MTVRSKRSRRLRALLGCFGGIGLAVIGPMVVLMKKGGKEPEETPSAG
ncbi:hypothetical protein [Saccharothrix sp. ALI-22-I]|nr:hypothetical protein [Saccharothrix sp. ALI-22-I]